MRRCLRPRREFTNAHSRLDRDSSMGTVDGRNSVDDKLVLDRWTEAERSHVFDESLHTGLHQATSAFWRIDTNRASFVMETTSLSSKRFG